MSDVVGPSPVPDILTLRNLCMYFPFGHNMQGRPKGYVKAVDDVTLSIPAGTTLGLVGESGCGKTTLGRCIVRAYRPTAGQILYRDARGREVDLAPLSPNELTPYRRQLRMMFQDPFSSLCPRMRVLEIVGEPMRIQNVARGKEIEDRVAALLIRVGLRPEYMRRYPHAFSGGQRQRIGIARALALEPRIIVADEAVSALDVSVRAQILKLLGDLQRELNLTYLFISHDLSVVEYVADRVAVMYVGKLVEVAETEQLYATPRHPYTEALLSAVPSPDPDFKRQRVVLQGDIPDPAHPPPGCYFHPRCSFVVDRCRLEAPALRDIGGGHVVACHLAEKLQLRGVA